MKKTLSLLLALVLLAPLASLAETVLGPLSVSYGKSVYEVEVTDISYDAGEARVFIEAQDDYYLVRFMHEDREAGFEPLEDIVLPIDVPDSPFYSAVLVALEVEGRTIPFYACNATHAGVEFLYEVDAPPEALLLYPRDGSPETAQRLAVPEGRFASEPPEPAEASTPEVTAEPTPEPTAEPTAPPEVTPIPAAGQPAATAAAPSAPETLTTQRSGEATPEQDTRFTVGGNAYEIFMLQDEPIYQRENRMDDREGHCILFSYQSAANSEETNHELYDKIRVITPDGEEIHTYSNDGNTENPYTLYFGLPDGVMLGDCLLRVPDDAGQRLLILGGGESAGLWNTGGAPAAREPGTAPSQDTGFTINGTAYEVFMLQDVPIYQMENRMDDREGHCILFSYETSATSEEANGVLFTEARIVAPDGEKIRTYGNDGNAANPYTLYFGLPGDVLLGDCMLLVPDDDDGTRLLALGDGAAAGQEEPAEAAAEPEPPAEPAESTAEPNIPEPSGTTNARIGSSSPLNKELNKPIATQAAESPTEAPTVAPATAEPVAEAPATEVPAAEEPTAAPQAAATGFEDVVGAALRTLAEEANDPWQKAIYEAGAVHFALEDEDGEQFLTFALRSFDPNLKELGAYPGGDAAAWRAQMYENISAHNLPVSLKLQEGELSQEAAQKALQRNVRTAAEAAKTAFNKNAMRECIADLILPMPAEKLSAAADLDTVPLSDAFAAYAAAGLVPDAELRVHIPLFYGQVSQKLSVKDGPHALVLNCKGAAPATLLENARDATLETLSQQYKANEMDTDAILSVFLENLVEQSNVVKKKGTADFSLLMDIDAVMAGDYGADYEHFLAAYTYGDMEEEVLSAVWALPDAPPQELPKNGYLSGSKSGTKVIIKAPADGLARYVQMRISRTDEVRVTLFLRSGGSATVYVPKGFYYMLIASGENWYGEEGLFGDEGYYSKTSETEILGKDYYHTITLESSTDGNISTWGADMDDFF